MVTLLALILPLGLDSFAVAAALAAAGLTRRERLRVSLVIAGFEAGMPLVGLALGAPLGRAVGSVAGDVAIGLLIALGVFTFLHEDDDDQVSDLARHHGTALLLLGLSVSLDELAIGLLHVPIAPVIAAIGLQALLLSQLGLRLGAHVSQHLRETAERVAGIALTMTGAVLLIEMLVTA